MSVGSSAGLFELGLDSTALAGRERCGISCSLVLEDGVALVVGGSGWVIHAAESRWVERTIVLIRRSIGLVASRTSAGLGKERSDRRASRTVLGMRREVGE